MSPGRDNVYKLQISGERLKNWLKFETIEKVDDDDTD